MELVGVLTVGGGVSGTEDTDDFNAESFSDAVLMESLRRRGEKAVACFGD